MNKFRNVKTSVAGIVFDSKLEASLYQELRLLELTLVIEDLKRQVPVNLVVADKLICRIIPDFIYRENGKRIVHEAKGKRTRDWVIKWKLAQALYPEWVFRIN